VYQRNAEAISSEKLPEIRIKPHSGKNTALMIVAVDEVKADMGYCAPIPTSPGKITGLEQSEKVRQLEFISMKFQNMDGSLISL
jgi:hypothetical protein